MIALHTPSAFPVPPPYTHHRTYVQTVKYFTNEGYEADQYAGAIKGYQARAVVLY